MAQVRFTGSANLALLAVTFARRQLRWNPLLTR